MTHTEYRRHPALNYSIAKHLLRSAAHFRHASEYPEPTTDAMIIGTEIHRLLDGSESGVVMRPAHNWEDPDDRWHGNKKWCKEWAEQQTKHVVSGEDYMRIIGAKDAVLANKTAQTLLALCPEREKPVVVDYRGTAIKGLLDAVGTDMDGKRFVLDLKTTTDASRNAFAGKARSLSYSMQAAWYTNLLAISEGLDYRPGFVWVVVETEMPHAVAVYAPSEAVMDKGQELMDKAITLYQESQQSGKWTGYPAEIQTIDWVMYE